VDDLISSLAMRRGHEASCPAPVPIKPPPAQSQYTDEAPATNSGTLCLEYWRRRKGIVYTLLWSMSRRFFGLYPRMKLLPSTIVL